MGQCVNSKMAETIIMKSYDRDNDPIFEYIESHSLSMHPAQKELMKETLTVLESSDSKMLGAPEVLQMNQVLMNKINLQLRPATETLQELIDQGEEGTYDFAFIDADKPNYCNYFELCLKLLRPGGIITIDNVLFGGAVINEEVQDERTAGIRRLNDLVAADDRVY